MGGQAGCCAADDVAKGQAEIADRAPQQRVAEVEEVANGGAQQVDTANAPGEFVITVDKNSAAGPKLGVDVDISDPYLFVERLNDGLVAQWNLDHPDKEVKENMVISAVNGTRGNAGEMVEVIKNDQVLQMTILPEVPVA